MCHIIVIASGKGGTGKSTVAVGLATAFVNRNYKVLLVDCDCGMRGLDIMLDVEKDIVFDASDAVSGGCDSESAVYHSTHIQGLCLMPAPFDSDDEISPSVFSQLIDSIKDNYDYIIIDSPAGVGTGFVTAATPVQTALVVVNAEPTSVRGCLNIRKKLIEMGKSDIRLVINKFNRDVFFGMGLYDDLDAVIDAAQTQLIAVVPEDYRIVTNVQRGSKGRIWSESGVVFDCLSKRLQGMNIPPAIK